MVLGGSVYIEVAMVYSKYVGPLRNSGPNHVPRMYVMVLFGTNQYVCILLLDISNSLIT